MIKYYRLFDLLNRRDMKRTALLKIISAPTLAKLGKGQPVSTEIIDRICEFLSCQPEDIMEYVEILKDTKTNKEIYATVYTDKDGEPIDFTEHGDVDMLERYEMEQADELEKEIELRLMQE